MLIKWFTHSHLLYKTLERLVEHKLLKRALEELYSMHLPKGTHPFVYLDLKIKPENVDVNVHPTKNEVHFLDEEEIVQEIVSAVEETLKATTQSRKFYVQVIQIQPSNLL